MKNDLRIHKLKKKQQSMESNFNVLKERVVELSESNVWWSAKNEWVMCGYEEDEECEGVCTCGKHGLRHLYTILNVNNNNRLEFIGSKCILQFDNPKMKEEVKICEEWNNRVIKRGKFKGMSFAEISRLNAAENYVEWLERKIEDDPDWNIQLGRFFKPFIQYYNLKTRLEANNYL